MHVAVDAHDRLRAFVESGAPPFAADGRDAAGLVEAARTQGLVGLLATATVGLAGVWSSFAATLASESRALGARGVRQQALAGRVLDELAAAKVRALPLKGIALVETLYDSPSHRPMADVDLLALDPWREARRVLGAAGFIEVDAADHAVALRDPESSLIVDLHRAWTSGPRLFPLDAEAVHARSRVTQGLVARVPCPEDLLVHLSLHAAFQHGLHLSLVQYLDFRRLLERASIDAATLLEAARAAGAVRAVATALAAAVAFVGAPAEELLSHFPPPIRPKAGVWRPGDVSAKDLLSLRLALTPGRRLRLLASILAGGAEAETGGGRWPARLRGLFDTWAAPARDLSASLPAADATPPLVDAHPEQAVAVARSCLAAVGQVRLTVTGVCMAPLVAERQRVEIASVHRVRPRFGDVVLLQHPAGLRLHRLLWAPLFSRAVWRTGGDAGPFLDPPLHRHEVLGVVVSVDGRRPSRLRAGTAALRSLGRVALRKLRGEPR